MKSRRAAAAPAAPAPAPAPAVQEPPEPPPAPSPEHVTRAPLLTVDTDDWLDKIVYINTGRLAGKHGKVLRCGNGWVQLQTIAGEIAKRAYELDLAAGEGPFDEEDFEPVLGEDGKVPNWGEEEGAAGADGIATAAAAAATTVTTPKESGTGVTTRSERVSRGAPGQVASIANNDEEKSEVPNVGEERRTTRRQVRSNAVKKTETPDKGGEKSEISPKKDEKPAAETAPTRGTGRRNPTNKAIAAAAAEKNGSDASKTTKTDTGASSGLPPLSASKRSSAAAAGSAVTSILKKDKDKEKEKETVEGEADSTPPTQASAVASKEKDAVHNPPTTQQAVVQPLSVVTAYGTRNGGGAGGLGGARREAERELMKKQWEVQIARGKERPPLNAWLRKFEECGKMEPGDPEGVDLISDLMPIRCDTCRLEKVYGDRFCWNRECFASPVFKGFFEGMDKDAAAEASADGITDSSAKSEPMAMDVVEDGGAPQRQNFPVGSKGGPVGVAGDASAATCGDTFERVTRINDEVTFALQAPVKWIESKKRQRSPLEAWPQSGPLYRWRCWQSLADDPNTRDPTYCEKKEEVVEEEKKVPVAAKPSPAAVNRKRPAPPSVHAGGVPVLGGPPGVAAGGRPPAKMAKIEPKLESVLKAEPVKVEGASTSMIAPGVSNTNMDALPTSAKTETLLPSGGPPKPSGAVAMSSIPVAASNFLPPRNTTTPAALITPGSSLTNGVNTAKPYTGASVSGANTNTGASVATNQSIMLNASNSSMHGNVNAGGAFAKGETVSAPPSVLGKRPLDSGTAPDGGSFRQSHAVPVPVMHRPINTVINNPNPNPGGDLPSSISGKPSGSATNSTSAVSTSVKPVFTLSGEKNEPKTGIDLNRPVIMHTTHAHTHAHATAGGNKDMSVNASRERATITVPVPKPLFTAPPTAQAQGGANPHTAGTNQSSMGANTIIIPRAVAMGPSANKTSATLTHDNVPGGSSSLPNTVKDSKAYVGNAQQSGVPLQHARAHVEAPKVEEKKASI